ncbi:MAG: YraN family protein [Planctomycetota bacterium]|jgi:putative endonuclease
MDETSSPTRLELGQRAERYAATRREAEGWALLAQDLRTPVAQVDLLLRRDDGLLVVAEVKARGPTRWLEEEDILSPQQRRRLARALAWVASQAEGHDAAVRLDLAVVDLVGGEPVACRWIEELEFLQPLA